MRTRGPQIGRRLLGVGRKIAPIAIKPLVLADFPSLLRAWEADYGVTTSSGAYGDTVSAWACRLTGDSLVQATDADRPMLIPGAYTRDGRARIAFNRLDEYESKLSITFGSALPQPLKFIHVADSLNTQADYCADYRWPTHFAVGPMDGRVYDLFVDAGAGGPYVGLYLLGEDSGLDCNVNYQSRIQLDLDGAGDSRLHVDRVPGAILASPPVGWGNDVTTLELGRLTTDSPTQGAVDTCYAHYIFDGSVSTAELDLFYTYLDQQWPRPVSGTRPGSFPTFGASDYDEWCVDDMSETEGQSATSNIVGRQNGKIFVSSGANHPVMRETAGRQGGKALEFASGTGNQYLDCAALTMAHPSTFIVSARCGQNGSLIDGRPSGGRMVMYVLTGSLLLYAGASVNASSTTLLYPNHVAWRQYAAVFNDNASECYVDGDAAVTSMAIGTQDNTAGTRIGANPVGSGFLDGWIDHWAYWDKVLTQDQIRQYLAYAGDR